MVVVSFSPSLDDAVAATADVVAELASGRSETALAHMQALARSTHGRCVLGLAGFVQLVTKQLAAFVKIGGGSEEEEEAMAELLVVLADAMLDEDNATFAARLGAHMPLLQLMEHENEAIQEAAAHVVGNCTAHATGITFPFRTRPLEPPTRPWPMKISLPQDPRDGMVPCSPSGDDGSTLSVLIRQVPTRMTGQSKTGYLLWGAAFVLARWVHLHRELFVRKSVLEVGSGLGLGGITAARYAQRTVLTDYQGDTCTALDYNAQLNRPFTHQFEPRKPDVVVQHLDWDLMETIRPEDKMDIVMGCDIICEPSTAEGFLRVVRHRLSADGVAYLMNADSHSRFGVTHLHELLAQSGDLEYSITAVHDLPDGAELLETVADAQELSYEFYEIRLKKPVV